MRPTRLHLFLALLIQAGCLDARAAERGTLSDEPRAMLTEAEVRKLKSNPADARAEVEAAKPASHSRLSEKPKPLLREADQLPKRNPPIFEWNEPFLGAGNIKPGFLSPTGAIWQPALWVFGDYRATAGYADNGVTPARGYVSNRLDIFGHLQLTPTERVLIGFSPLSRGADHTGVQFTEARGAEFVNGLNPNIQTLFFEGDTRQLFPGLDRNDTKGLDFGFSIGRQPIFFQEGIMVDDPMQALAITKDTMQIPGLTQDIRVTGLFGWADIRRNDNLPDHTASMFGVFTETDFRRNIITFDFAYVTSSSPRNPNGVLRGGDGMYFGASTTQRFGEINTAFRINTSTAIENKGPAIDNGVLFFTEISRNAPGTTNIIYANFFQTIGNYTSAARSVQAGGPLARTGILFAAPVAGLAGSPLSNRADHVYGGAIGYQMFFDANRTQLTLEVGARDDYNGSKQGAAAIGGQYIRALTERTSVQVNAFVSAGENRRVGSGAFVEMRTRL